MIEPLDYLSMMGLVQKSFFVITDSGGLQKEAYFAGKRAIIVMPDTDWRKIQFIFILLRFLSLFTPM